MVNPRVSSNQPIENSNNVTSAANLLPKPLARMHFDAPHYSDYISAIICSCEMASPKQTMAIRIIKIVIDNITVHSVDFKSEIRCQFAPSFFFQRQPHFEQRMFIHIETL